MWGECQHNKPIAVCRLYYDAKQNAYIIGRLAIHKDYRHQGYGSNLIHSVICFVKNKPRIPLLLHAQCRVIPFYQTLGFEPFGEIDYDEHTPHQWMKKD